MAKPFPRWLMLLFLAVLAGGIVLIAIQEPQRFWQDAWLPALAIVGLGIRQWLPRRAAPPSGEMNHDPPQSSEERKRLPNTTDVGSA